MHKFLWMLRLYYFNLRYWQGFFQILIEGVLNLPSRLVTPPKPHDPNGSQFGLHPQSFIYFIYLKTETLN
jgi:hypothetical protein